MSRKYVTARRSQILFSQRKYNEEMKRTEEDIQPSDIEQWKKAEEKRQRKNKKRFIDNEYVRLRTLIRPAQ